MHQDNITPHTKPYDFEKLQIIKEIGDLELVRKNLGLSRRKISKLLLVDPSSWTRWTKEGTDAPAYIYRSLQWALAIMDKYPESHPLVRSLSYEKENKVDHISKKLDEKIGLQRSIMFNIHEDIELVKKQSIKLEKTNSSLKKVIFWQSLVFIGFILGSIGLFAFYR